MSPFIESLFGPEPRDTNVACFFRKILNLIYSIDGSVQNEPERDPNPWKVIKMLASNANIVSQQPEGK
jgi:hypothetical protein